MNHLYRNLLLLCILSLGLLNSCREDAPVVPSDSEEIANSSQVSGGITGFYLLNEGNFQANNSSLDYMNLVSGTYTRNPTSSRSLATRAMIYRSTALGYMSSSTVLTR